MAAADRKGNSLAAHVVDLVADEAWVKLCVYAVLCTISQQQQHACSVAAEQLTS
jgi:hypothetical protein